jgi:DNA-binding MarR family transcriptional regulator
MLNMMEATTPVAEEKWLTQKEIAEMLDVPLSKLYPRVSALRKAGVIETRPDPDDDRLILISRDSLDVIRRAVGRDASS